MTDDEVLDMTNVKIKCTECKWRGFSQDVDRVPDPRGEKVWNVCPLCRTPENFDLDIE